MASYTLYYHTEIHTSLASQTRYTQQWHTYVHRITLQCSVTVEDCTSPRPTLERAELTYERLCLRHDLLLPQGLQLWAEDLCFLSGAYKLVSFPDPPMLRARGSGKVRILGCADSAVVGELRNKTWQSCDKIRARLDYGTSRQTLSHDIFKPSNLIGLPVFRTRWLSTTKNSDLIIPDPLSRGAREGLWERDYVQIWPPSHEREARPRF